MERTYREHKASRLPKRNFGFSALLWLCLRWWCSARSSKLSVTPSFEKLKRESKRVMLIFTFSPSSRSFRVGAAGQLTTCWALSSYIAQFLRTYDQPKSSQGEVWTYLRWTGRGRYELDFHELEKLATPPIQSPTVLNISRRNSK